MIRDRRDDDFESLRALAARLGISAPERWLSEVDAERSWVFDQAPVAVAPTRNVIGHVQIYRTTRHRRSDEPDATGDGSLGALVVGHLAVDPGRFSDNITRFLLRESVRYAHLANCAAVLETESAERLPRVLLSRAGFVERETVRGRALVHPLSS